MFILNVFFQVKGLSNMFPTSQWLVTWQSMFLAEMSDLPLNTILMTFFQGGVIQTSGPATVECFRQFSDSVAEQQLLGFFLLTSWAVLRDEQMSNG